MNTSLESKTHKTAILRDRAHMLQTVRAFFDEKQVLEVDCPALSQAAPIDQYIDVMQVIPKKGEVSYLHTSAEYGMKRLLVAGMPDIYQLSHVFRKEEMSPLHQPEFMMAEWYRIGFSFEEMIEETLEFIRLFVGPLPKTVLTYRELFSYFLQIDSEKATLSDLLHCASIHHLHLPESATTWDKETLLQLLLGTLIEPKLGKDALFVLTHYPASQAALAKTSTLLDKTQVAHRFEIYYQGIELANGYEELTDAFELRKRFEKANEERKKAGKEALKMDEEFLKALEKGLPNCCGVAVGFDRLMLLRHKVKDLKDILPFPFENIC